MKAFHFLFAAAALVFGLSSAALSAPQEADNRVTLQGYTPGLGEFMSAIQMRHAKLWFAGRGGNWPLAAYELDELKEAFEDAARYQPHFKGKPIAEMIGRDTAEPLTQLGKAIEAKDRVRFSKAFDDLSRACTSCHRAAGYDFIAIQRPTVPPLTNQRFDIRQ